MTTVWVFALSVLVYAVPPLVYTARPHGYRFLFLYVHLAAVLTVGGLLGAVYLLPVAGVTLLAGQVSYAGFMFTAVVTVIVARDGHVLRNVAALSIGVNLVVFCLFRLSVAALSNPAMPNPQAVPVGVFQTSVRSVLVGGVLIVAEVFALLVIYELAKRRLSSLAMIAVYLGGYVVVLAADGVLFPLAVFTPVPDLGGLIVAGVEAKLLLAAVFAVPLLGFVALNRASVERFEATPISLKHLLTLSRDPLLEQLSRSERAAGRWESTVDRILDAASNTILVTTDPDFRITRFNQGAVTLLGFEEHEVLGKTPEVLRHPAGLTAQGDVRFEPRESLNATWRRVADGVHRYATFRAKSGASVVVSLSLNAIHDGELIVGYLAAGEDVTRRVEAERAVSTSLHREQESVRRLQEADHLKDELVSTVSHELRTPIASIQGYVELLAQGALGEVAREQSDALARVDRNIARLRALVDDLLFFARGSVETTRLAMASLDLREVVTAAWATIEQLASDRRLTLICTVPPTPVTCCGDGLVLERLFLNLAGNAVKFTPDGGQVALVLEAADAGGRITVRDTGIGIPPADLEHVFDRFFRSTRASKAQIAGSGLGLSVAHDIVNAHSGTIGVESDGTGGTTVTVWLPCLDDAMAIAATD